MTLLSIQPTTLFVPSVYAGAVPAAASRANKKNKSKTKKYKPKRTKTILKGHHGKHNRKPA
jgi:hypothetical protein